MSAVIDAGYTDVDEVTDYYWQLVAPVGTADVNLDLGTIISEWDEVEQKRAVRAIAAKLRLVAGLLDEKVGE